MRYLVSVLTLIITLSFFVVADFSIADEIGPNTYFETINVGGLTREYIIHLPDGFDVNTSTGLSLVLILHGNFVDAETTMEDTNFNKKADEEGFIVVYPQGYRRPRLIGGYEPYGWNDSRGTTKASTRKVNRKIIDDIDFINKLISELCSYYNNNIDTDSIYAAGISNGGFMVQDLSIELSHRFAATATVIASLPANQDFTPTSKMGIVLFAGVDDPITIYEGGKMGGTQWGGVGGKILSIDETVEKWAEYNGCDLYGVKEDPLDNKNTSDGTTVIKKQYKNCGDFDVVLYQILGGGHGYPGGTQYQGALRERLGNVCQDINATDEIWEFFEDHSK
jgi:polyhydroxybutyrate depolymerase